MRIADDEVARQSNDAFPCVRAHVRMLDGDQIADAEAAAQSVPFVDDVVFGFGAEGGVHGGAGGGLLGAFAIESIKLDHDSKMGMTLLCVVEREGGLVFGAYRPVIAVFLEEPCAASCPGEESNRFGGLGAEAAES
jgi:hypothetical protein